MNKSDLEFLKDNQYLFQAIKDGAPKHVSELQAKRLLSIAKTINPEVNFQIRDCQDCINSLVKFVYLNSKLRNGKA